MEYSSIIATQNTDKKTSKMEILFLVTSLIIKRGDMFSRRHPFLFSMIIMAGCCTLMFVSLMFFLSAGAKMVSSSIDKGIGKADGNIGIVEITGMILASREIIEDIKTFRENENIKAIVLRIDSPGGGIGPSQEIYREVMRTRSDKNIIASMGSVAASGGYYIASATEGIIASPGTITGSIGVIMEYANLMEIAKKIGISPIVVKSGEYKDMGSPLRDIKESERRIFQNLVDNLHKQFVSDVAYARDMDIRTVESLSDGRVYTGQQALSFNLVDRLGNLEDAVLWAGELAEIDGELKPIYPIKEDKVSFVKRLIESLLKDINLSGNIMNNPGYVVH